MSRLFVRGVSERIGQKELEEIFEKFGKIDTIQTGQAGFAFVEMENERDVNEAIHSLDGSMLDGQKITVERARGGRDKNNEEFRCYNCNRPGHLARDCKEKPRNPLYVDTRGTKITDVGGRSRYHPYDRPTGGRDRHERDRYERSPPRGGYGPRYSPPPIDRRGPPPDDYYRGRNPDQYRRPPSPERMYGGRGYPPAGGERRTSENYRPPHDRDAREMRDTRDVREMRMRPVEPYYERRDDRRPPEYPPMRRTPPPDMRGAPPHHSHPMDRRGGGPGLPPPSPESFRSGPPPPRSPPRRTPPPNFDRRGPYERPKSPEYRSRTPERYRGEPGNDHFRTRTPERYRPPNSERPPGMNESQEFNDRIRSRTPERFRRDRQRTPPDNRYGQRPVGMDSFPPGRPITPPDKDNRGIPHTERQL